MPRPHTAEALGDAFVQRLTDVCLSRTSNLTRGLRPWLKWFCDYCEAEGAHLTKTGWGKPPYPFQPHYFGVI